MFSKKLSSHSFYWDSRKPTRWFLALIQSKRTCFKLAANITGTTAEGLEGYTITAVTPSLGNVQHASVQIKSIPFLALSHQLAVINPWCEITSCSSPYHTGGFTTAAAVPLTIPPCQHVSITAARLPPSFIASFHFRGREDVGRRQWEVRAWPPLTCQRSGCRQGPDVFPDVNPLSALAQWGLDAFVLSMLVLEKLKGFEGTDEQTRKPWGNVTLTKRSRRGSPEAEIIVKSVKLQKRLVTSLLCMYLYTYIYNWTDLLNYIILYIILNLKRIWLR